jgi:segregation and condensation protein A
MVSRDGRISALGLVVPPPIHIQTPTFDGSLEMLFGCVREHRVDLLDIPLSPICEAYFGYMLRASFQDLDQAAAALAALAYLLERKAWLLLPVPEPEPEFEEPMPAIEASSQEYRLAIEALSIWQSERELLFFRSPEAGPDPYELPYTLANVSPSDLARAFERLLKRASPEAFETLSRPRRSLEDQMDLVLASISEEWRPMEALIPPPFTRIEAVYWFLALLELMRMGRVRARVTETDVEFARV